MAAWGAWYGTLDDAVLDGGAPIGVMSTIAPDGSVTPGGGAQSRTQSRTGLHDHHG